ncbi:MAG: hypothetical protein C0619_00930 [Desulfuromonas sp.]|nr:MAG: hypothetical protein C0619_00930 [Desulfuromonas sp.]
MIFLPRGNPVKEKVNPARVNLPEAMGKLRGGSFSGYMRFDSDEGTGVVIFEKGRLISALFQYRKSDKRLIAYDAIARIFEISIQGAAELNIYRVDAELALGIHGLLHGDYVYRGQEIKLVDVCSLLETIKRTCLTGCLRVYAEDKVSLIFYEEGCAKGFFLDGFSRLQQMADVGKSVAKLPGAKLDLLATRHSDEIVLADLMASADLGTIWRKLRSAVN